MKGKKRKKKVRSLYCHAWIYAHTSLLAVADVAPAVTATSGAKDDVDDEEVEEPGVKVLSKKEKEKLKKEREKVCPILFSPIVNYH
jgi:hypothetical protein